MLDVAYREWDFQNPCPVRIVANGRGKVRVE